MAERVVENKLKLLLNFEKAYPNSRQLAEIYTSLMDIYIKRSGTTKASEYGEKALKKNPKDVVALVQYSRLHALLGDLGKAIEFAEEAVSAAAAMKTQTAPSTYNASSWQTWVASLESNAKTNLTWVRERAAWQRSVLVSGLSRRP